MQRCMKQVVRFVSHYTARPGTLKPEAPTISKSVHNGSDDNGAKMHGDSYYYL